MGATNVVVGESGPIDIRDGWWWCRPGWRTGTADRRRRRSA